MADGHLRHAVLGNPAHAPILPPSWRTLAGLAKLDSEDVTVAIALWQPRVRREPDPRQAELFPRSVQRDGE